VIVTVPVGVTVALVPDTTEYVIAPDELEVAVRLKSASPYVFSISANVMVGATGTMNSIPSLEPLSLVTTALPVVAPTGTIAVI
jgi:hypothetical protein